MDENCIQLEMNFNGNTGNRFKDRLDQGVFQVLFELDPPSPESFRGNAAARFKDLEYQVMAENELACALAFPDHGFDSASMDMAAFASELCQSGRDSHLMYLSGRGKTPEQIRSLMSHAASEGFKNFCCVSGAVLDGETAADCARVLFTESVNTLKDLRDRYGTRLLTGATLNPFKYTPSDDYTQYFKLVKKLNFGASFVVTQFGWDMMKLQEMRWNLYRRSLHVPSIARLLFLTPDKAEDICAGKYPGVHISPDFQVALRHETMHSHVQFEAAQLRRLQLHAAGAKLLGFSGIQIAGIDRSDLLAHVLKRIKEAFQEFRHFEEWRDVYQEYYSRMDMAPYPNRYYMFENLFSAAQPPEDLKMREALIPKCTGREHFLYDLSQKLFSHAAELPAAERRITKKLLCSCRSCSHCRLPLTDYVCPEICPKGMANGPCGGSQANGNCEFSDTECIFARRMRLANERHDFSSLEDVCVDSLPERPR